MIPSIRTTSWGGSAITRKLLGAGAAAAVLALGPIGAVSAFGATQAADSSSPQCQLFTPLEGGIEQFQQAWNGQVGSQAPITFSGQTDIAQQIANGSGCPIGASSGAPSGLPSSVPSSPPSGAPSGAPGGLPSGAPSGPPSGAPSGLPSGPPSSGGGSGGSAPQCALFDPVTGGLQQVEAAWNTNSGQYTFTGSNDIAAAIDAGAGCDGTKPLTASPSSGGGSGSGSSSAPQCQLFTPVEAGIEQVEQQVDANSNGQNPFAGSNDIAQQIANGSGCPISSSAGGSSGSGSSTSGGGNTGDTGSGGSSGSGSTSSNGGGSGSGTDASFSAGSGTGSGGGSGSGSGALAFTGEPTWIPAAGVLLLVLAGLAGFGALSLRLLARRQTA